MQSSSRSGLRRLALSAMCLCLTWGSQFPASAAENGLTTPAMERPLRERGIGGDVPAISYIDSPTATCYRVQELSSACYIEWGYLYVSAGSSQYIVDMTVEIDGRVRASLKGFFQTSMYVPGDMFLPGFIVACGQPGSGGNPFLGQSYSYAIRASETGGLTAANYGSVVCPATRFIFSDGFETGGLSAWSSHVP